MFIPIDDKKRDFSEHTLIVPAVCVGNVGQLTADLLISTLFMQRIGFIQHSSILPLVGGDPFAHPEATGCKLVSCCEVFESVETKSVVIQQRAPFVKGRQSLYRKWLVDWIKDNKFKKVVIPTSSFAQERLDVQLEGEQFRMILSKHVDEMFGEMFRDFYEWTDLERRPVFPAPSAIEGGDNSVGDIYIPGGGIAKSLYQDLKDDVPCAVFLIFCSEGDNAVDAIILANRLNRWLSLVDFHSRSVGNANEITIQKYSQWKTPTSWKLFYGNRFDQTLFH